jgi:inner membrane protein
MASFGHFAVGMMAGRLQCAGGAATRRPGLTRTGRVLATLAFALLALLPDGDLIVVALGASDGAAIGHRGGSHSLLTALALGIVAGILARRLGWSALRTALAVMLAVGSHGILDAIGQGGRGIPLFWPLSEHRFMAPSSWRILPDAPRGMKFLSRSGLADLAIEFLYFLPFTIYALLPARATAQAAATEPAPSPEPLAERPRDPAPERDQPQRLAG